MAKRRANITIGTVFGVPLKDGSRGVAQVLEIVDSLRMALCAFYSDKVSESDAGRAQSIALKPGDVVAVQPVSLRPLQAGEWPVMGNAPVANPELTQVLDGLREVRFVGLSIPNTNTIEALMDAYHGLAPWEIGTDTDFLRRLMYRQR